MWTQHSFLGDQTKKYSKRDIQCMKTYQQFNNSSFLNTNQLGFCSRSSVATYSITCIYIKYLADGPETGNMARNIKLIING